MKPSSTELTILKALWAKGACSAREIHLAVSDDLQWSYSSTRKTIDRMLAKKMVTVSEAHGLKIYRAKLKKIPTLAAMVRAFTAEVLGLSAPLPVSNLLDSSLLTSKELEELEEHLKALDAENGEDDT